MTDFSGYKAPFISANEIHRRADVFREEYWDATIPVDIDKIVSVKLAMNIVPKSNMHQICNVDAIITSTFDTLVVDFDHYMDDVHSNRMRFSFAHEIGHYVLHRPFWKSLNISSTQDYIEFISTIPQREYRLLEYHAYEFAGRLLVPIDHLQSTIDHEDIQAKISEARSLGIDDETIRKNIAPLICKSFGVSDEVIKRRLEKEDIIL